MPFKSQAQAAYFNANRDKLEAQGVNVDEWNASSRGLRLPKHVGAKHERPHKSLMSLAQHLPRK